MALEIAGNRILSKRVKMLNFPVLIYPMSKEGLCPSQNLLNFWKHWFISLLNEKASRIRYTKDFSFQTLVNSIKYSDLDDVSLFMLAKKWLKNSIILYESNQNIKLFDKKEAFSSLEAACHDGNAA